MKTYNEVADLIRQWKAQGLSDSEIVVNAANACIGWPYVYGGRGEECNPQSRGGRANDKYPNVVDKCQVLNRSRSDCNGCPFYPNGRVLFFDCRGFTYWLFKQVGISLQGAGATTQFGTDSNWEVKGPISEMPKNKVCCVFRYDSETGKMEHTLLYDGKGNYIHCSGEVKKVPVSKYKATHYAIPKGFGHGGGKGSMPEPTDETKTAVVYAENGKPVKMRAKPSTDCKTYWELPCGSVVEVLEAGGEWTKISKGNHTGYMMSKFLKAEEEAAPEQPATREELFEVCVPNLTRAQAEELMNMYPEAYMTVG